MDLKELRIGNLVTVSISTCEVSTIEINDMVSVKPLGDDILLLDHISGVEPIPLTPEWLVRFGFEHRYEDYWDHETEVFEVDKNIHGDWVLSINYNEYIIGDGFKYVHQLQNLYFALTGKELSNDT